LQTAYYILGRFKMLYKLQQVPYMISSKLERASTQKQEIFAGFCACFQSAFILGTSHLQVTWVVL
jgi:hypothetical protein